MFTKEKILFIATIIFILWFILNDYHIKLHDRLEESCNKTGGSYLGGMCVHPIIKNP